MTADREPVPQRTGVKPPATDPWKGFRGVMAGTLILEVIVVLLAFPVVWKLGDGLTAASGVFLGLVTLALIVLSGMCARPWALPVILGLQVILIVGGLFHWSIAVVGVVFLLVWAYIAYIRRDVARRMELGLLPSQR